MILNHWTWIHVRTVCWDQRQIHLVHQTVENDQIHSGRIHKMCCISCNNHKCCCIQIYRFQDLDRVHCLIYRPDSIILDHHLWAITIHWCLTSMPIQINRRKIHFYWIVRADLCHMSTKRTHHRWTIAIIVRRFEEIRHTLEIRKVKCVADIVRISVEEIEIGN